MRERAFRRAPARAALALGLGLVVCSPVAADARPESATTNERADRIVLDSALEVASHGRLEQSLRELLARIDLRLVGAVDASSTPDDRIVARVSVELSADAAIVSVTSPRDIDSLGRYRVERTSDELFCETLAHVIFGAVEPRAALLRGALSPPPDPVVAPNENLERDTSPETVSVFDGSRSWSLGAHGKPMLLAAHQGGIALGASLGVAFRALARPSAALDASYLIPVLVRAGDIDAQLSRVGLRLRARVEPLSGRDLALQVGVASGLDVITLTPGSPPPERSVNASRRVQAILGGSLGGRLRAADGFDIVAAVGAELELAPRRWLIEGNAESRRFYETPRWVPYAMLGIEWQLGSTRAERSP
jgi:hypothetical protein